MTRDFKTDPTYKTWEGSERELARQFALELNVKFETVREVLKGRCWNVT